ncbi:MAG: RsmE family RNA methyltransferase [Sphaerochaetaceae bacterium]|nr:RsmE family RNA methyltransferase [Sphaerochaetaceae bacterium]
MNMILFEKLPHQCLLEKNDERTKHILEVLKLKVGDTFKMGIVNESEGLGKVLSIENSEVYFSYEPQTVPSLYPVILLCAQVRPICMKRILREAVSLGVETIILTGSDTGEKSYISSNLYKTGEYKTYLLDGAMQACHGGVPEVLFAEGVNKAMDLVETKLGPYKADASLILLDNAIGASPLSKSTIKGHGVLAIGPERGWSPRERKSFIERGYEPKLLGNRVLRTETACSTGIAILLSQMGLL